MLREYHLYPNPFPPYPPLPISGVWRMGLGEL